MILYNALIKLIKMHVNLLVIDSWALNNCMCYKSKGTDLIRKSYRNLNK